VGVVVGGSASSVESDEKLIVCGPLAGLAVETDVVEDSVLGAN